MLSTLEKTQRQHERRLNRERQLKLMEEAVVSSKSFLEEASDAAVWRNERGQSSSSMDSSSSLHKHPPPVDTARRFLWEDNDDENGSGLGASSDRAATRATTGDGVAGGRFGSSVEVPLFGSRSDSSYGSPNPSSAAALEEGPRFRNLFDMGVGEEREYASVGGLTPDNSAYALNGGTPTNTTVLQSLGNTIRGAAKRFAGNGEEPVTISSPSSSLSSSTSSSSSKNPFKILWLRKHQQEKFASNKVVPHRSSVDEDGTDASTDASLSLGGLDDDDGQDNNDALRMISVSLDDEREGNDKWNGGRGRAAVKHGGASDPGSQVAQCCRGCASHSSRCMEDTIVFVLGDGSAASRQRRFRVLVAMAMMALGLAVATRVDRLHGHTSITNVPEIGDGGDGNDQDLSSWSHDLRFQRVRDALLESVIRDPKVVELQDDGTYPDTPQYRALDWIVREDSAAMNPSDPYLAQRYALAVFWFATTDEKTTAVKQYAYKKNPADPVDPSNLHSSWNRRDNWMSFKGICSWWGIQCRRREGSQDVTYEDNNMVTVLNLTRNGIHGTLPGEVIEALSELEVLDLSSNILEGPVPPGLGDLPRLQKLVLTDNFFNGNLPASWGNLAAIQQLLASNNEFTGTIPSRWGKLSTLQGLGLSQNLLKGSIPVEWGSLGQLVALDMDSNHLTGTLPPEMGELSKLSHLSLHSNELQGSIPPEWEGMVDMQQLYLYSNKLEGTLPPSFGSAMGGLVDLGLQDNHLTGTLPPEYGGLVEMETLLLERNELSGIIPDTLGKLSKLRTLHLSDNDIIGNVPEDVCALTDSFLQDFRTDCSGYRPLVICSCCSQCD